MKIIILQIVNYTLSFFMWMIVGRALLTLMIGKRDNFAAGLFAKITDPVYRVTRRIVPFAKESCIPALSILLIVLIRLILVIVFEPGTTR